MNKALSKQLEQAARKHDKSKILLSHKDSFIKGGEFINKNSNHQYDVKDMYQILYEGIGYFICDEKIKESEIKKWFKNYIKK